ncbi:MULTISPECIES: hypothetical protein [Vibrio]|uniref:Uncharacterized protein n=1 Tax=Vibrio aestuarianus TaxID=28171 RepID=A0A9X4EW24_9VIBR|nr:MULTISPECIES: hypothetical protein [Vibrio]MDE1243429.1 hypothetical protein [Vibrio aestuarianus]MDQ2192581.1 hypothetical protein [Vibrio sp. A14(2019)]MDQ2196191.1 hypothetical protein [Vibrio sp. 2017_1457_11]NNN74943.1 hypothetical protein [Vibrio sp. B7]NNN91932.1 hypothetical protein [Vibrio sp. B8-1]
MNQEALRDLIQEEKALSAEEKLHKALARLQNGIPLRTKAKGRLTLNKINNEAGLGRSYIHKFKEFVDKVANPAIEAHNELQDNPELSVTASPLTEDMSEIDRLKDELRKQIELKEGYRIERDEALAINDGLEALNKSLMFRVYELQQELPDSVAEYEDYKK